MDRQTTRAYERAAEKWIAARTPRRIDDGTLARFARALAPGALVADLGCGPGWYGEWLRSAGFRVVALDAAHAMLRHARRRYGNLPCVNGDLLALPFGDRSLDAAWAMNCYQHLPLPMLPMALARLHWALRPGATVGLTLASLDSGPTTAAQRRRGEAQRRYPDDTLRGRLFTQHSPQRAHELLEGAGFTDIVVDSQTDKFWLTIRAVRGRTLPDLIGPRLRLLICGLNPSVYSADRGIPFARPGNRFWPAALAAGLVERERDPLHALARGIGLTDIVKRATAGADELSAEEHAAGLRRVEKLVRLYKPRVICFVGLDGWRRVLDRRAQPGWVEGGFGGRPAYLMPSTSGRNARVPPDALAAHLQQAVRLDGAGIAANAGGTGQGQRQGHGQV